MRILFVLMISAMAVIAADVRAGAAAVKITPPKGAPMAGYYFNRAADGVHDDLFAKALVVESEGVRVALVACDVESLPRAIVEQARRKIEADIGIGGAAVMISATHSHTGPVILEEHSPDTLEGEMLNIARKYAEDLPEKIAESVKLAAAALKPVGVSAGIGREPSLTFNRRFYMKDGSVGWNPGKLNPAVVRPAGPTDPAVPVVYFEALDGPPLATYVNYAMHLDTVGGFEYSADYAYTLSKLPQIRQGLQKLQTKADEQDTQVREAELSETKATQTAGMKVGKKKVTVGVGSDLDQLSSVETERKYTLNENKIKELDGLLPKLKQQIREFFELSSSVKAVFLQLDDFYHLKREDQPLVMDYIHRLCKDVPLYFKVATLRHASTLYADRHGQPLGAQERHDYQPINIDFTFFDFKKTVEQNRRIFNEFGTRVGLKTPMDDLFKGQGFERLVLAGGGVPRDCLSLFLEVLDNVQPPNGDGRIGKDDVRILSRANFERRIEELKQDSEGREQGILIRGIYVLRQFCIEKKSNVLLVPETLLQQNDRIRNLLYRLLDYRIIHSAGSALTHKSQGGTYHAFAIDIGCYAHMRKLEGRFTEIDLSFPDAKEKMRSGPILDVGAFDTLWASAPADPEAGLRAQE